MTTRVTRNGKHIIGDTTDAAFPGNAIVGRKDGVAVEAGNIGEKITWSVAPTNQGLSTSEADWTNATFTVSAGIWLVFANIYLDINSGATAGNNTTGILKITDSSNVVVQNMHKSVYSKTSGTVGMEVQVAVPMNFVANVNTNTTYKIRSFYANGAGTGSGNIINQSGAQSEFFAIRIA